MKRILITDDAHPILAQRLRQEGFGVDIDLQAGYDDVLATISAYDAIVVRSKIVIDRNFIDRAPHLCCIGRLGAGMETIDVDYAESKGIRCLNSPEGNRDAVGEHAVGLLLALFNNIARADAEVRKGLWRREANRGRELGSCTVGIIGYGNMGGSFARRLQGFGCRVLAYDKYKSGFASSLVEEVSLDELQRQADVISLHVPLTDETRYMVNSDFLNAFARPIALLNTSRGAVVRTSDLATAMRDGKVWGAALDVIEYEALAKDALSIDTMPDDFRYLCQSPHTVLSPHVAGWTVESLFKLADVLADKMIHALAL